MNWIPRIFRRRRLFDELSEEMRLHLEERVEQLKREGLSPEEAERQARIAFGNLAVVEERSREVWQWPTLESIAADVRFAVRQLRRSPGFTIAAVLTLTLAIGANAVVFGVLNALILKPLNVPHAQSLFTIERGGYKDQATSYPDYLDLRDRNRSFEALTAYILVPVGLDTGKNPIPGLGLRGCRKLLPGHGRSAFPWPLLQRRRRAWPQQRSVFSPLLGVLAHPFSGRSRRRGPRRPGEQAPLYHPRRRAA